MTPRQIVTLCVRLVALVWLLYTVSHVHELFAFLDKEREVQLSKVSVLLFASLQIVVCVLLWFFPRTIAAKLLPGQDADIEAPPSKPIEWQTLGVICIGIWALTRAIPDAVYWVSFYNMMKTSSNLGWAYFSPDQKAAMLSTVAELAIGFWLLLGAQGIAAILFKARTAGTKK